MHDCIDNLRTSSAMLDADEGRKAGRGALKLCPVAARAAVLRNEFRAGVAIRRCANDHTQSKHEKAYRRNCKPFKTEHIAWLRRMRARSPHKLANTDS